ncbi:nucleotide sugar dehydrogenase [Evansella sp. AB-rgal1]|uniref:nucleotide sugar dehydrogenase n=1 Tax=Evansella sp. AB-rgal1 TaxID=3242696 RepID=UPI00359E11FA
MKEWNVAVIGLGFIGLPLSLSYAMKGANVIGLDINETLITEINSGHSHHLEYYEGKSLQDILQEQLKAERFRATSSYEEMAEQVDNYIITVGVDVKNGDPQLANLQSAMEQLSKVLKKGDTVLLRSTVVPGTTEELVKPILEQNGLTAGEDFYLGYSSERIAEGRAFEEFRTMPLAAGGMNPESLQKVKELLQVVTEVAIHETEIKVVETAKIIENVQRDVNIAMVQEFARFAERTGMDTYELMKTANTHTRVNLLTPGPGVGGYCLPNALYYLLPKAAEHGLDLPLLRKAREINDGIPLHVVEEVINSLQEKGKLVKEAKVAVLGLAMKDFSNDDRISPPHDIVNLFLEKGLKVAAYDPAVPNSYSYKVNSLKEAIQDADALVYLTVQEEFVELNWDEIISKMKEDAVVYDAKNRVPLRIRDKATLIRM